MTGLDGEYVPSTKDWVREQIETYEASGGTRATTLRDTGIPIIVVTMRGNKTGAVRKIALMRVEHGGEYALIGSYGGSPTHPVWYHNLVADPENVWIQDGPEPFAVRVREVEGDERTQWWDRSVAVFPNYAEYQTRTERQIPVLVASAALTMLTPLDDTLAHQAPLTFDHAVTSDHRFFDRWAVGVQHAELSLIYGLATYKNTNTSDGFLCVQRGGRQYNLRLSRPLLPGATEMRVGPLAITVTDPLRAHHLVVDRSGDSPLACDIEWVGVTPPREEAPHFVRRDGRVVQDYLRYDQLGQARGWVAIGDDTVLIHDWFAWRDHSWGVRPGMGGADPVTPQPVGDRAAAGAPGIFVWIAFRAGPVSGQFQVSESGTGVRHSVDGHVLADIDRRDESHEVVDIRHAIEFTDGRTTFTSADLDATTSDGQLWHFEATPLRPPWAFIGSGYSGGWNDGLGLGVPRGDRVEVDEYQVSDDADVVFPDGTSRRPWHRETDVRIRLSAPDGQVHDGDGHLTVIVR